MYVEKVRRECSTSSRTGTWSLVEDVEIKSVRNARNLKIGWGRRAAARRAAQSSSASPSHSHSRHSRQQSPAFSTLHYEMLQPTTYVRTSIAHLRRLERATCIFSLVLLLRIIILYSVITISNYCTVRREYWLVRVTCITNYSPFLSLFNFLDDDAFCTNRAFGIEIRNRHNIPKSLRIEDAIISLYYYC